MRVVLLFFFAALLQTAEAARSSIVVFPLVNKSNDSINQWISYALPEYFSRKLCAIEGIRVWDPLFMFQTDSIGWKMDSDSLLLQHRTRWQWDAAVGGTFVVKGDSIRMALRIVWVTGTRQNVGMDIQQSVLFSECSKLCASLLLKTCSLLRIELSSEDSLQIKKVYDVPPAAYHTYCAGYGFEITGNYSEALTAYNRALDLAPSFTLARCRSGGIYLLTGQSEQARRIFKKVIKSRNHTLITRAMAANFVVDQFSFKDAYRFIDASRVELEKSAAGLTVIGKQYLTTGEYQRAIAVFRRALAWGPTNLDSEFLLGMTYLWSGEYDVAIDLFDRLILIRPDYIRYRVSLGAVYRKAERLMESLSVLEMVKKKEPENVMVLVELAHTCFALTWYRKAGQLLELAHQLKPDQNAILIDLGIIYWYEKRFADAERCFKIAGKHSKGKQASFVNRGNIALMQGDVDMAIGAYRKADRYGKKNPTILYNLATVFLKKGDLKKAAKYFDELLLLTPNRVDLLIERASLAQQLGNIEDAELAYQRILENDPYHEKAISGLIQLLLHLKRYEEAISRIERYLEIMPARSDFLVLLADAYRVQGWYEVAMVKYQQIVKDFPDYDQGYIGVGRCMYEMLKHKGSKQYDETLFALKKASSKAPLNPVPHELMGDIYWEFKGYREMAVEQWRTALKKTTDEQKKQFLKQKITHAIRR